MIGLFSYDFTYFGSSENIWRLNIEMLVPIPIINEEIFLILGSAQSVKYFLSEEK